MPPRLPVERPTPAQLQSIQNGPTVRILFGSNKTVHVVPLDLLKWFSPYFADLIRPQSPAALSGEAHINEDDEYDDDFFPMILEYMRTGTVRLDTGDIKWKCNVERSFAFVRFCHDFDISEAACVVAPALKRELGHHNISVYWKCIEFAFNNLHEDNRFLSVLSQVLAKALCKERGDTVDIKNELLENDMISARVMQMFLQMTVPNGAGNGRLWVGKNRVAASDERLLEDRFYEYRSNASASP